MNRLVLRRLIHGLIPKATTKVTNDFSVSHPKLQSSSSSLFPSTFSLYVEMKLGKRQTKYHFLLSRLPVFPSRETPAS